MALNKASWRAIAVANVVIAAALLAGLLAQDGLWSHSSKVSRPDGLTTLALVLAILAFLLQIFIYVFQSNEQRRSERRSEEVFTQSQQVLGKIETNSAATQRVLFSQFDRLLDYIVGPGSGVIEADQATADSPSEEEADSTHPVTRAEIAEVVSDVISRSRPVFSGSGPSTTAENLAIVRYLRDWPPRPEFEDAVQQLKRVSPLALSMLTRFATEEIHQRLADQPVGLRGARHAVIRQLLSEGLIVELSGLQRLTDEGRRLARVLPTGRRERPDWADAALAPLLERIGGEDGAQLGG